MKRILLLSCTLGLGGIARAEPEAIDAATLTGKFAFDWTRGRGACRKVDGAFLKKLKAWRCTPPDADTGTASGKPLAARCAKGQAEYLVFATKADCDEERETQAANAD